MKGMSSMSLAMLWQRFWNWLCGWPAANVTAVTRGVANDANEAAAYGVQVTPAAPAAGASYWKIVRVRHLAPQENGGRQNLYVNINDEAGARVYGAQARIGWASGSQVVTVDKPTNEPGTNLPMWPGQVCDVIALGVPGLELVSDRATGLHTDHPDEGTGNTRFHHSFEVTFQRAAAAPAPVTASVIEGHVTNAAGRTIALLRDGATVATAPLAADGAYAFSALAAGTYRLAVSGTDVTSADIAVDGQNRVTMNLAVPVTPGPGEKPLAHYVLLAPANTPAGRVNWQLAVAYVQACGLTVGFDATQARQAKRVTLIGGDGAVPEAVAHELAAAGCQVVRVSGDSDAIEAELARRIATGTP